MEILPGARADSFDRPAEIYLLSHFHEDHMAGLGKGWSSGPLYASKITCRLLADLSRVDPACLRPLGEWGSVRAGRWTVTALPANHCPGSVMFHVERDGVGSVLYTGDFRLDDGVRRALAGLPPVDTAYVDCTYSDQRYSFPPQEEAVRRVVEIASRADRGREVMLAVYTIGKNRIVEAVSRACESPVYMPERLRRVYELIGMGRFVTGSRESTRLRGYARAYLEERFRMLPASRRRNSLVIVPTGWARDERELEQRRFGATFHYVPYSEHCDAAETVEALSLIRAGRVVRLSGRPAPGRAG